MSSSSCSDNNYVINAAKSYCVSSSDCGARRSTQNDNTRDTSQKIKPYPDIITHNVDVNNLGKIVDVSRSSHKQTPQPQYACVDKKNPKNIKPNQNDQLVSIVKHKDHHQHQQSHQQKFQQQPEIMYQQIQLQPSTHHRHQNHQRNKNEASALNQLPPKIDVIKTTYPDL